MKKQIILSGFLILGLWMLTLSCSASLRNLDISKPILFPSAPDTARIQFFMNISNSLDVAGRQTAFSHYVTGDEEGKPIIKPYGIGAFKGKLYICDTMLPGLEIINLKSGQFKYFIPEGPGELKKPLNCAFGEDGSLYVCDVGRNQVVGFDRKLNYLFALGDGKSGRPTDVQIYDRKIWVCDLQAHQIKVYDKDSQQLLFTFPEVKKATPQYLFSPTNISVRGGKVYVTDTGDARIKVFTDRGRFIKRIGGFGKSPGFFVRPKGLTTDNDGLLYVVDAAFENVQMFDAQGRILMYFGGSKKHAGSMWLPAGIEISYELADFFKPYVFSGYVLKYIIAVSNQYGPNKIGIYGFIEPKKK